MRRVRRPSPPPAGSAPAGSAPAGPAPAGSSSTGPTSTGRTSTRSTRSAPLTGDPVRRIRHDVRDGLSVAALSCVASVGATAVIWAAVRWLG